MKLVNLQELMTAESASVEHFMRRPDVAARLNAGQPIDLRFVFHVAFYAGAIFGMDVPWIDSEILASSPAAPYPGSKAESRLVRTKARKGKKA